MNTIKNTEIPTLEVNAILHSKIKSELKITKTYGKMVLFLCKYVGLKGILTESRKRMYKQIKQNKCESLDEDQDQTKNPWGALSETWGSNEIVENDFLPRNGVRDQGRSIKERLGLKCSEKDVVAEESGEASSSDSDSDESWCKRSKIPRMRMHADDEEEKVQKRRAKLRFQVSFYLFRIFS